MAQALGLPGSPLTGAAPVARPQPLADRGPPEAPARRSGLTGVAAIFSRFSLDRVNQDDLRVIAALIALLVAGVILTVLSFGLDPDSTLATVVLDRQSRALPYPFTVQNLMHFMFALGVGEVFVRLYSAADGRRQIEKGLLQERTTRMLSTQELRQLHRRVIEDGAGSDRHLHRLIHRIIVQYEATGSVGDAQQVLDSSVEYFQHGVGLRYNMLRYLTWLLPTLGFIGTLIGISLALGTAGTLPDLQDTAALESWINTLTTSLGVAFYTTLVGLALSAVLVFCTNIASSREEQVLNDTGQYCLDNIISRLRNRIANPTQGGDPS